MRSWLQKLYQTITSGQTPTARTDNSEVLVAIAAADEPAAILAILQFVFSDQREIAQSAASAVHQLILKCTTHDLIWLDRAIREQNCYSGHRLYEWFKMYPERINSLANCGEISVSLLGIASFHWSGYVREPVVKQLDLISSGAELPFLLLRLNDWVSVVRDLAYKAVRSRLNPKYGTYFVANLALVDRLGESARLDHKDLLREISEFLQSKHCRPALLESLKSANRYVRRTGFKLAIQSTTDDSAEPLRSALTNDDIVVRMLAAQKVLTSFDGPALDGFLLLLRNERYGPIRREALRIDVKRNLPGLGLRLRNALLDSHPSMREEARYHLRRDESLDVASFYREHLKKDERTLFAAISGLGEIRSAKDAGLIVRYASHSSGKIRRATIGALGKINVADHIEAFLEALADEVPHVSRQAQLVLSKNSAVIDGERVWKIFQSAQTFHVKRNALRLIEKSSKWDSIYYLLSALSNSDELISDLSQSGIRRWLERFNRSFGSPTTTDVARITKVLDKCGHLLDKEIQRQIRFFLKT